MEVQEQNKSCLNCYFGDTLITYQYCCVNKKSEHSQKVVRENNLCKYWEKRK